MEELKHTEELTLPAVDPEQREAALCRAPVLGKWLWVLFWLVVPGTIAGILTMDAFEETAFYTFGTVLNAVCTLAYGFILLKMSDVCGHYRTACICMVVSAAGNAAVELIWEDGSPTWVLLPLVLLAIAALAGVYREYLGHSEMLEGVDGELAEKWRKLWKWYIISFAVTIGGIFAALISPVLAIFVVLGGAIAAVVVSILKLVYLYRTAKVFRALAEEVEGAEDGI
ncbi:MAG: hypothetical protein IJX52_06875 [Oscillibacter sp.]|nr:hypothetical protein [Oscillibacter sp.]